MKLKPTVLKEKIVSLFKIQTYVDAVSANQNPDWQIAPEKLKELLSFKAQSTNLEIIAVLENLKLPFQVNQTIHINKFNAKKIKVDYKKTYVMVCQRGFNSYRATEKLKQEYPNLEVLNLTGGISSYK
jgi:adenylyltransferase/sulfurtransferase